MRADNEMTVLITSGKNEISLFIPVMIFSLLISVSEFYIQTIISPNAYARFNIIQEKMKNRLSMSIVKARTFNVVGSSIIYIGGKKQLSLEDIFISYVPQNENANVNIVTAKRGAACTDKSGNYFIVLENGCRQELRKDNAVVSSLRFSNFSYDITPFLKRYDYNTGKPNSKTQAALLRYAATITDQELKRNCIAEYHYRFLSPFITIINAMVIGLLLLRPMERGGGKLDLAKGFSLGALNQICFLIAKNISTRHNDFVCVNYVMVTAVVTILGICIVRRSIR
jgi:lipopolysaccharide export LptBFGC system permease protein LptF